jgi:hypothetical protein
MQLKEADQLLFCNWERLSIENEGKIGGNHFLNLQSTFSDVYISLQLFENHRPMTISRQSVSVFTSTVCFTSMAVSSRDSRDNLPLPSLVSSVSLSQAFLDGSRLVHRLFACYGRPSFPNHLCCIRAHASFSETGSIWSEA